MADRHLRAGSFGAVADLYARSRPGPPVEAVEWLVPAGTRRAVDLGAGTGALGAVLARLAAEVIEVEPDRRMLAVTAGRAAGNRRTVGTAEAIPLRGGCADFLGVASAWHWMDHEVALAEVARVLRPGGVFGVLWSGPDRQVPWVTEILASASAGRTEPSRGPWERALHVPDGGPFDPPVPRVFTTTVAYPVADLVGLVGSYSTVITLPDDARREVLRRAAGAVAALSLDPAGVVDLPLSAVCWRTRRR